jgi:hypothetical protein
MLWAGARRARAQRSTVTARRVYAQSQENVLSETEAPMEIAHLVLEYLA